MLGSLASIHLLAQQGSSSGGGGFLILLLIEIALLAVVIAGCWKMFVKAGQPGWAAIIPIYNLFILCKIVGRPGWWVILFLIPFVNFIMAIILSIDLAKSFGKSMLFAVGLVLLSPIFYCILGFGSAQYQGPSAANA